MLVDDSAVIRGFIGKILASCPEVNVTSISSNGQMAINNLSKGRHDVILLDVEMPTMDGLTAIPKLLAIQPDVKIIMCSTLTTQNAETSIRALSLGAVECIAKPTSTQDIYSKDSFRETLVRTILEIAKANTAPTSNAKPSASPQRMRATSPEPNIPGSSTRSPFSLYHGKAIKLRPSIEGYSGKPELLAIGSSTGGPNALFKLLSALRGIDVPILVTQHMPPTFTKILSDHINQQTGLSCVEAEDGMPIVAGRVHVAPGGFHMLVDRKGATPIIRIDDGPMENFCRPAVDPMFRSATKVFGQKIMAVILTGMGQDGMLGARDIVASGGRVIAQDEATSVVWGMPGAVAHDGTCSAVLPLDEIGPWLRKSSLRLP